MELAMAAWKGQAKAMPSVTISRNKSSSHSFNIDGENWLAQVRPGCVELSKHVDGAYQVKGCVAKASNANIYAVDPQTFKRSLIQDPEARKAASYFFSVFVPYVPPAPDTGLALEDDDMLYSNQITEVQLPRWDDEPVGEWEVIQL
jgi:hypothetical protein